MAYDQRSYQPPRRQQQQQQYQQDYAQSSGPQYTQQYNAQPQTQYAAQDYGTFDPYAQDAGNPYNEEHGRHTTNGNGYDGRQGNGYESSQIYGQGQPPPGSVAQGQQYDQGYGHDWHDGSQTHGHDGRQQGLQSYDNARQYGSQAYGNNGYQESVHNGRQQSVPTYSSNGRQQEQHGYGGSRQQDSRGYNNGNMNAQQSSQAYNSGSRQQDSNGYGNGTRQQDSRAHGNPGRQQQTQSHSNPRLQQHPQAYDDSGRQQSRQAYDNSQDLGRAQHNGYPQQGQQYPQNAGHVQENGRGQHVQASNQRYVQPQERSYSDQGYKSHGFQASVQRPQTASSQAHTANGQAQYEESRQYQQRREPAQLAKSPPNSTFSGQASRHAPVQAGPKKLTMEEWKAQEKAKMHKDASKPETLAQDNAFPTFPTKKAEPSRSGGESAMSRRSGDEEHTRTSTSSSRPQLPRNNSSQVDLTDSARPSLDHKVRAHGSARPSIDSQHRPERIASPLHQVDQAVRPARTDSYNTSGQSTRAPQSIDLNGIQGMPPSLAPLDTSSQARPSSSDSNRYGRKHSEQPMSPLGKFAQSAQAPVAARQPSPSSNHQHHPQQSSLSDVYDGYYDKRETVASKTNLSQKPMTRDEEIEAEMPDFDSAAPSQTSLLHKRKQTIDQHLNTRPAEASPMPVPQASQSSGSASTFDFGFQQQQNQHQHQPGHPPYQPEQPLQRPVQPYANDMNGRRSMDDARQGQQTLVNGRPPPQRFYGESMPRPDYDRQGTTHSDPGLQRTGSAPPVRPGTQQSLQPAERDPRSKSAPGNPDALPAHPTPVRAGLVSGGGGASTAARPPPVRNYGTGAAPVSTAPAPRAVPADAVNTPVTHAELKQLHTQVEANPQSMKLSLTYAKKLVEASKVLATEGGRADAKTTAKNRERYIMDAYKRVKKLVSAGYPDAQFYLADCYGQGMLGLEVDAKEAFKLYQAAAKSGHGTAAYRTAVCCEIGADEGGGTSRDYPRAVQWYRRAAALGDTAAMFKVGMICLKGLLGQPRNLGEATTWLKRAAERADKDNPHALHELGQLYESSNSSPDLRQKIIPDDAYALSLYKQAAGLGAKHSQFRLGQAYEYGQLGLGIDHRSSIAWYSKAAAQGEHQAELALSGWYLTGAPGILEHSDTEAYLWARKAAQAEPPLAKAMFAMGYFLETGIGCAPNVEEAKRWYGRAASYKHPKALERLEAIKRGVKGGYKAMPANKKISRKDQKHDEAECAVM